MQFPGGPLPERPTAKQRAAMQGNMGPARAELQRLMLDRAWTLLEAGECEAADALLEFVPEPAATALLDEFFPELTS